MIGAVPTCDFTSEVELVERALAKADGKRGEPLPARTSGQSRENRGVDSAGQQNADRDVGEQMCADRIEQTLAKFLGQDLGRLLAAAVGGGGSWARVTLDRRARG